MTDTVKNVLFVLVVACTVGLVIHLLDHQFFSRRYNDGHINVSNDTIKPHKGEMFIIDSIDAEGNIIVRPAEDDDARAFLENHGKG